MKVSIKGTRGSVPTTDPATGRHGGNTSCVTIEAEGHLMILDGGTGIQKVQLHQIPRGQVDILLTHLHLDHIQGLGFFKPLFESDVEVRLWAPSTAVDSLHQRLSRYLSPPLFPVRLRDLPCKLELHDIGNSDFSVGPFQVSSRFVIHTGPTVGFRVETHRSSMAFIPDHEPALGQRGMLSDPKWISGFDLASGVSLLVHDGHYTSDEYPNRKGWGHSSMEDALLFARHAQAKRLLITHHDPSRTDDQLDLIYSGLLERYGKKLPFGFAKEGEEILL